MIGRNDRCPCGSGKKYKKCCESKEQMLIDDVQAEELERILQVFYETYPERKDIQEFIGLANKWKGTLENYLAEEMIEAIVLDEFFFHYRVDIWTGYLEKQVKKQLRPSVIEVLSQWQEPTIFIGEVIEVVETYIRVKHLLTNEVIKLKRESEKPVSVGAHLYCFTLPNGDQQLAVSSLIFLPVDHQEVFIGLVAKFETTKEKNATQFLKEHSLTFWEMLGKNGYQGGEFTEFEAGVLIHVMEFLEKHDRSSDKLLVIVEDYLVEQQPSARKDVAIAAGAIRFGIENNFIESLQMPLKDIAEWFGVSPSSMNKYSKELLAYSVGVNN